MFKTKTKMKVLKLPASQAGGSDLPITGENSPPYRDTAPSSLRDRQAIKSQLNNEI